MNAWLWEKHKTALQWRRIRLGPIPNHEMARAYKVILRWADAIFIEDGVVNIVEAKLRPNPTAIGQLEYYKELFPATPEFEEFSEAPIQLWHLAAITDLGIAELCSKKNINFEVFMPDGYEYNPFTRQVTKIKEME